MRQPLRCYGHPGKSLILGAPRRVVLLAFLTALVMALAVPAYAVPTYAVPTYDHEIGMFAPAEINPLDIASDADGNWYVLDGALGCVRVYGPDRKTIIQTFFTCGVEGEDDTHMRRARGFGLHSPTRELWIADTPNDRLVKVDANGNLLVSTNLAESPNGELTDPRDVVTDNSGNAYVTDGGYRIVKVSPTGEYLEEWGIAGSGDGEMTDATSIAFSDVGGDALYVSDVGNYRVAKFGLDGSWLGSFGSEGTGDGQFTKDSRGITVDSNGTIYAADIGGNRILRWASDGTALPSFGGGLPYYRSGPLDTFYGGRGLYANNNILAVSDTWNYRVLLFDLSGASAGQIGGTPPPPYGHLGPHGVELDQEGNIYVSDYWHQWIQKFAPDGTLLARWGIGRGRDPGTLAFAGGIEVDNARQYLYIANREGRVVDRWRLSDGGFDRRFDISGPLLDRGFPRDVAVNEATGIFYVADEKNLQVDIISADGTNLGVINRYGAGEGQPIGEPFSVQVDELGGIYVADYTNRLVHVYDANAAWLRSFRTINGPRGIDVRNGKVYVLGRTVSVYTTEGTLIDEWGSVGFAENQLFDPYVGIAVDSEGRVYIGDSGNHQVKVFRP